MPNNESFLSPFEDIKLYMDSVGKLTDFEDAIGVAVATEEQRDQCKRYVLAAAAGFKALDHCKNRAEVFEVLLQTIMVLIGLGVSLGMPMKEGWDSLMASYFQGLDKDQTPTLNLEQVINDYYKKKNHLQAV